MSDIKVGDLVMVVRKTRCCSRGKTTGKVFRVAKNDGVVTGECGACGATVTDEYIENEDGHGFSGYRLKKIDPPAEGDSLPTRADLEVTA